MASSPTFKPSIFVGRTDPKKLAPLLDPDGRQEGQLPRPEPRDRGPVSARLDVQAGDRAGGDAGAADLAVPDAPVHAGLRRSTTGTQVFKNWDPYAERADDAARRRSAPRATPTSTTSATRSTRCRPTAATRCRAGRAASASAQPTGIDVGPEQDGLLPTPEWRQTDLHEEDRPVLLADRPALEAGRLDPARDRPEGPARHAAPDGALLLADRERRQARQAARRRARSSEPRRPAGWHYLNPPLPKPSGVDPAALAVVRDGLYRATHASYGTATAVFGSFPIPIAGKTGTAEKVVQPPGYAHPVLQDQSWWCGYAADRQAEDRGLRRDRERRPRRHGRRARRAEGLRALLPRARARRSGRIHSD